MLEELEVVRSNEGGGVAEGGKVSEIGKGEKVEIGRRFAWKLRREEGFGKGSGCIEVSKVFP